MCSAKKYFFLAIFIWKLSSFSGLALLPFEFLWEPADISQMLRNSVRFPAQFASPVLGVDGCFTTQFLLVLTRSKIFLKGTVKRFSFNSVIKFLHNFCLFLSETDFDFFFWSVFGLSSHEETLKFLSSFVISSLKF